MEYVIINYKNNQYRIPENELIQYRFETPLIDKKLTVYSQRDPKWGNMYLGDSKLKIKDYGCLLCCYAMISNIEPNALNESFKRAGVFSGPLIIQQKACDALGLKNGGREYDISKMPKYYPCIKEVTMGRSQHFVVRMIDKDEPLASSYGTFILDPWTGKKQPINKYPFRSYRLVKIPK